MPLGTDAELDFMLRDAGIPVVYGAPAQNTYGLLDRGELLLEGQGAPMSFRDKTQTLVIRAGSLVDLRANREITVNGAGFTIRDPGVPDTEGWQRITLVEGAP